MVNLKFSIAFVDNQPEMCGTCVNLMYQTDTVIVIPLSLQVIPYWLAQMLGAFISSVVLYGVYFGKDARIAWCL